MGDDHRAALREGLLPEVADFAEGGIVMARELENLARTREVGALEGTIFYGARVLEALAAQALRVLGERPHDHVYVNLETLRHFDLVSETTLACAHALRRMGNDVRHVRRHVLAREADVALVFAELCLEWYFCAFPLGRRLASLTLDGVALLGSVDPGGMRAAIREVETLRDRESAARLWTERRDAFLEAPALVSRLAEHLIDRGALEEALAILSETHARFPDELRVEQLIALAHSRAGRVPQAAAMLERLLERVPDEEETQGILAGALKRSWIDNRDDVRPLERAFALYKEGWRRHSKRTNVYLGVNAAATALWLGRNDAAALAGEVLAVVEARAKKILERLAAAPARCWEDLTFAEVTLLSGDLEGARGRYRRAAALHAGSSPGAVAVALAQLELHLSMLGRPMPAHEFLESNAPP